MRAESQVWLIADSIRQLHESWPDDSPVEVTPTPEWVALVERLLDEWMKGRPWHPAFLTGNLELAMDGVRRSLETMRQTGFARFSVQMGVELNAALSEILGWPKAHQMPHTIPSIKMMDRQGVPHEQIARTYGLVEPITGRGIIGQVEQELAAPGSVIGDDWVHPLEQDRRDRRERIESWLAEFPEATSEQAAKKARSEMRLDPVAPEPDPILSVEEAFLRGLDEVQAAEILDLPLAQVMGRYSELQQVEQVEMPEVQEEELPSKDDMLREAKELGIVLRHNYTRTKLAAKIREAKQARLVGEPGNDE